MQTRSRSELRRLDRIHNDDRDRRLSIKFAQNFASLGGFGVSYRRLRAPRPPLSLLLAHAARLLPEERQIDARAAAGG